MENSKKLGQEPAFSCPPMFENGQCMDMGSTGMSKRLYLAGMAMQGILAGDSTALTCRSDGDVLSPNRTHTYNSAKVA